MASMKQNLFVVVWEWENKQGRWRPYPPEVTQQLERAFSKGLRSVFLGDADPALSNYSVNLSTLYQTCQQTGDIVAVRRNFYPQSSPAGSGAVWQWNGDNSGDWHVYDMPVQCIIEESWAMGAQTVDMSNSFPLCPYIINFCSLTQTNKRSGFIRSIRRIQQAAYPVGRPPTQTPPDPGCNGYRGVRPPAPSACSRMLNGGPVTLGARLTSPTRNINPPSSPPQGICNGNIKANGILNKRRGSRGDEVEVSNTSDKKTGILHKMFGRGQSGPSSMEGLSNNNSGCSSSNSQSSSNSSSSSNIGCSGRSTGRPGTQSPGQPYTRVVAVSSSSGPCSPPKPLPRSMVPPTPKPRTHLPPPSPSKDVVFAHPDAAHHHPILHRNPDSPQHTSAFSRASQRSESGIGHGRFGSNHTIDSDCSSLIGGRRPSIDTISTYLSLDSCNIEDQSYQHSQGDSSSPCDPRIASLISVDSEESMDTDDEVFSVADAEVANISTAVAHGARNSPSRSSQAQDHLFVPISAPASVCETGLQYNGVKRKRTGERASLEQGGGHHSHQQYNPFPHNHNLHYHGGQGARGPIKPEDKLLLQYTKLVMKPPDEMCPICMESLQEVGGFTDEPQGCVSLMVCSHMFHLGCLREMARSTPAFLQCPNCKALHGEKTGIQPPGEMEVLELNRSLPGHQDCNTIQITYRIRAGLQGLEHPNPGHPYQAIGFPRIAYLPNNNKGKKVLGLLQEAWRRRLIFTIGTSVTSGLKDVVTWNEIHHKTEWHNRNGHGYPDPHYLDNIMAELTAQGLTETTLV